MKKRLLCLIFSMLLLLVGCGKGAFDRDTCVEKLREKGFETATSFTTPEELRRGNESTNEELRQRGEDFTVEFTNVLNLMNDRRESCTFLELATEEQARLFCDYSVRTRIGSDSSRYAQFGKVIVVTDSEEVMELLGGAFE